MNHLADALWFLLIPLFLVVFGAAFPQRNATRVENFIVPGAVALGLYGTAVWLVGSLWRFDALLWAWLPWPLLIVTFLVRRVGIAANLKKIVVAFEGRGAVDWALAGYLTFVCGLTFLLTLAPPTGNDYDSLTYHLAVPQHYLRAGAIVELRYDHHSYFPFLMEMLYALGLAAKGAVFAKLFHWLTLPLACLTLMALGSRVLNLRAGLVAACLYVSLPLVTVEATTAYIDLAFVAFTLLAVLALINGLEGRGGHWWLLSGVFVGFCLGTKYFGALVLGFLGCWMLGAQIWSRQLAWKPLLAFTLAALLVGGPWYLRNFLWTGNPVYPFAFEIFGGAGWTAEMAKQYTQDQSHYGFGKSLLDWVWLPWRLSMTPLNAANPFWPFVSGAPLASGYWGVFDVRVLDVLLKIFPGPMLLAFGLPALLLRGKPRSLWPVVGFFVFLWIFWGITSQQMRYLLPGMALMCLIAGWGAVTLWRRYPDARLPLALSLGLWCLMSVALQLNNSRMERSVLLGQETDSSFLSRTLPPYNAMAWASRETPAEAKFAVYGEPRCFYLDRDYIWADDEHNNLLDYAAMQTDADLLKGLRKLGITHVLVNTSPAKSGGAFGPPPKFASALSEKNLEILYESNGYQVYALP